MRRLPAYKSGVAFLLPMKDVKRFKLNPPGRTRIGPPVWHAPNSRSTIMATDISVQFRPGHQETFIEKLKATQRADQHMFPGTIARYVIKGMQS